MWSAHVLRYSAATARHDVGLPNPIAYNTPAVRTRLDVLRTKSWLGELQGFAQRVRNDKVPFGRVLEYRTPKFVHGKRYVFHRVSVDNHCGIRPVPIRTPAMSRVFKLESVHDGIEGGAYIFTQSLNRMRNIVRENSPSPCFGISNTAFPQKRHKISAQKLRTDAKRRVNGKTHY